VGASARAVGLRLLGQFRPLGLLLGALVPAGRGLGRLFGRWFLLGSLCVLLDRRRLCGRRLRRLPARWWLRLLRWLRLESLRGGLLGRLCVLLGLLGWLCVLLRLLGRLSVLLRLLGWLSVLLGCRLLGRLLLARWLLHSLR